ncbi:unnamed protein product [Pneumocystis jirovecii]|uniref:Actin-related protein 2/3 complex subunit 3 n=2 Tax=Pneumocystis jirovecii TaxID=42068 RepID=L0P8P5_PNEJI|nr:uncharacterized protein T551_01842 [Pneumocystis jirovecii RU7]KTW30559.1 hypothetical protein T551_01842 [Pneumocystis jirovecii RU7]CCJ28592.1 unnamed protein product [Pneumocystis jirovecii]
MPAYHSSFINDTDFQQVCGFAILPLKTRFKGPSQIINEPTLDIIDESIELFRANCFFRNFEIKGPADRTLIYGILFISDCLNKLSRTNCTKNDAIKLLNIFSLENFTIPGDSGFPFNSLYASPSNEFESGLYYTYSLFIITLLDFLRQYLSQFRQELALRLIDRVYIDSDRPNKWWLCFSKRKFMNKTLS